MDRITPEQRSRLMSRIRSRNTGPERLVFAHLRRLKIPFQRHSRHPGRPDASRPSRKLAVFVEGSFWHGWQFPRWERGMSPYWRAKIAANRARDRRNRQRLRRMGWRVLTVWEHDLRRRPAHALARVSSFLAP